MFIHFIFFGIYLCFLIPILLHFILLIYFLFIIFIFSS